MKSFLLSLIVAVMSFGFVASEAEAKRLGGGSSFGMNRQATPPAQPRQPAATQQTPAAGAATAAAQPKRSWMGPIAGLAAGLGLAALFSHLGLGEAHRARDRRAEHGYAVSLPYVGEDVLLVGAATVIHRREHTDDRQLLVEDAFDIADGVEQLHAFFRELPRLGGSPPLFRLYLSFCPVHRASCF